MKKLLALILVETLSSSLWANTIAFKKTLEISEKKLFVDGIEQKNFKCPHKLKKAKYQTLVFKKRSFALSCFTDYSGGYFLEYVKKPIAQLEGDAGSSWDKHSLLFHDKKTDTLVLWRATYGTYDTSIDCDGLVPITQKKYDECLKKATVKCRYKETFYQWNDEALKFKKTIYKGIKPSRNIKPFAYYLKNCSVKQK